MAFIIECYYSSNINLTLNIRIRVKRYPVMFFIVMLDQYYNFNFHNLSYVYSDFCCRKLELAFGLVQVYNVVIYLVQVYNVQVYKV